VLPGPWPAGAEPVARVVGAALIFGGLIAGGAAVHSLDISLSPFPRPAPGGVLVVHGPYRWIRHPIYTGLIAAAFGGAVYTGSVVAALFAGALAVVLDLKSHREEFWLRERFAGYAAYAARTRRFVPGIY
jgi:protein-S-isoprenylcysteine O-methyltransferase Ste14